MLAVAIIGAGSKLGAELIEACLASGHLVRAVVRDPRRLQRSNENLTVFHGDPESGTGLEAACRGADAVVIVPERFRPAMRATVGHVVGVLQAARKTVGKVVLVSRVGVGDSDMQGRQVSGPLTAFLPGLMRPVYEDLGQAEGILRVSRLPYLLVRTTRMTGGAANNRLTAVDARAPVPSRCTRVDVARFIVRMIENPTQAREITVGTA